MNKLTSIAESYLRLGKAGAWGWESCVEDIASELGLLADDDMRGEAVHLASTQLNKMYHFNKGARSTALWNSMEASREAIQVVEVVKNTFASTRENPTHDYSATSLTQIKNRLISSGDERFQLIMPLLEMQFSCYPEQPAPIRPGLYALWRAASYGTLVYIGQGKNISARLCTYVPGGSHSWWGRPMIWATFAVGDELANDSYRRKVEKLAIELLEPSSQ